MTVLRPGTRGDALRVQASSVDVEHLAVVGTVTGVAPLAVAARCGPGTGLLVFSASPPSLQFRAPGSSTAGTAIAVDADGDYLLEDGHDRSCWLRVRVVTASLPSASAQALVFLADRYNELGSSDVSAAEASAGGVDTFSVTLVNMSVAQVKNVKAWLDPSSTGLAISTDGITWYAPGSETDANVLAWAAIAAGASVTLYLKRTTLAGAVSSTAIRNLIQLAWDGL